MSRTGSSRSRRAVEGHDWGRVAELAPLLGGGLAVGLMSLVYYDRWMTGKRATPLVGPGAAAVDEFSSARGSSA